MATQRFTANDIIKQIPGSAGIKAVIAKRLGCHRHTITNYIDRYPSVRVAWLNERMGLRDMAESELAKKVKVGDWKSIAFTLTHLEDDGEIRVPKHRQEVTGKDGESLKVEYVNDWRTAQD